ncbi:MAG: chromosome segregation protein SMC, partial [Phycisphaerae bacterium]|nr:chromosome segregation protein SMC [Phycisphaerae bacterium]
MKIKRVDVNGFKSFKDKTVLMFDEAINGVVGPNGCGKSNIIDAIRWCMGEQSAKTLRGKMMEDVIFAGSEQYQPEMQAEVKMTLSTEGYDLPTQYSGMSEIAVSRKLYRNGDSGYYINNTPVRLLDVTEFFLGTGVGTKAYSIIEQGRVGAIVSARPEDRRAYIEEAAGISKYRMRRRTAERKLERTSQNLLRLGDIIEEVKRNLNSLHRAAKKAERFNRCKEELLSLEIHRALLEFNEVKQEISSLRSRITSEKAGLETVSAEANSNEIQIETERLSLVEEEKMLNEEFAALNKINEEIAAFEREIALFNQRGQTLEDAKIEIKLEDEKTKEIKNELKKRLAAEKLRLDGISEDFDTRESISKIETATARTKDALEVISSELEAFRAKQLEFATQTTHYKAQQDALERRNKEQEALAQRHKEEIDAATENETSLTQKIAELKKNLEKLSQLKFDLASESEKKSARLADISRKWEKTAVLLEDNKSKISELKNRRLSLIEIQKNCEGFEKGVKEIVKWGEEGGLYNLVANLIEPQKQFETAVEAVLGEKLQYIAMASYNEGVAAIDYLKTQAKGRASLIPLKPRSHNPSPAPVEDAAIIAELRKTVKVKEGFEAVADYLIGGACVVKTLDDAVRIHSLYPDANLTFATPEGDVVEASGVISGGSPDAFDTGFLQRNREIRELHDEIEKLASETASLQKHYDEQKKFLSDLKTGLDNLRQSSYEEEIKQVSLKKDIKQYEANLEALRERREALRKDLSRAKTQASEFALEVKEIEKRLLELGRRSELSNAEEQAAKEKQAGLLKKLEIQTEEHKRLTVQISTVEERRRSASSLVSSITEQVEQTEKRLDELAQKWGQIEKQNEENIASLALTKSKQDEMLKLYHERKQKLDLCRAFYDNKLQSVSVAETELKKKHRAIAETREMLSELALKEQEKVLNQNHMVEDYEQRYGINLNRQQLPETGFGEEQKQKIEWLREKIQELGAVNPAAIEEFEELSKRYEFLVEQREDLVNSVEKLKKAILRINRTSRKRFLEAFEAINERFSTLFPRLFNGGRAGLKLTDENDPLEAGVEIIAQPPGEKLKHIELLSGGQKALTAVAFIFSIF